MSWDDLQESWDRQQEEYLPQREHAFAVLVELVEAQAGPEPRVLDLACGTGSISARVLKAIPGARVVAADIDPVLLAIARGTFSDDPRVTVVETDLADPRWVTELPAGQFDAVLTATALHWLQADQLRQLYVDLAGLVRPSGLFANVDTMPTTGSGLVDAVDRLRESRMTSANPWQSWWQAVSLDAELTAAVDDRHAVFDARSHEEFIPPAEWHISALQAAGFSEASVVWRSHQDALVAAIR
jgi:SAM-dependent methyltransferase